MARIVFFTLNAYDMLTGGDEGDTVGGAQLQQILIGKELSERGHDVYFVEYGNKKEDEINRIKIVTKPNPTGSALSRAFTVVRGTKQVLDRINPDVCYRRVLNFEILPIVAYCNVIDCRFIYGVAHDSELTDSPDIFADGIKSTRLYRRINEFALSRADAVITQNDIQTERAKERLNTKIAQIPNCYNSTTVEPVDWDFDPPVVFWAARFVPWKQPDIVLDLAAELPAVTFVMAGSGDEDLLDKIKKRSHELGNVHIAGHIPINEIDRYFAAADLFLNTSTTEGFPNTFLQAWAQKTPVASLQVDPDGIVSSEEVGIHADGSVASLRDQITELVHDDERLQQLGSASQEYLHNNHTVEKIANKYENVFLPNEDQRN
jgi:glycosyltransferase involved in cell wall biosynthesis